MASANTVPAMEGMAADLRTAREALNKTQANLGLEIHRSQAHVSAFERGFGRTDARLLDRWAAALGYRWALVPLDADAGDPDA